MPSIDPRIDEYILRSADFAKPILNHLREIIHKTCPEVKESMKWSFPHFEYAGRILCSMASFKQHCAFGFWLGSSLSDPYHLMLIAKEKTAMGHFGQLKSLNDLPTDMVLASYITEAMSLNEEGAKVTKKPRTGEARIMEVPAFLIDALKKNTQAFEAFKNFSQSHKNEYIEWINEAKTETTRSKRMGTMLEWLAEGKSMNWKYKKV